MKELKSLEQWNAESRDRLSAAPFQSRSNGLACPQCGSELYDDKSGVILASNPGQIRVHCRQCKFIGLRVL